MILCTADKTITSLTIPNDVTSIGERAFSGCTGLTSVTIPDGVTSIGSAAFDGCTGLTSVTIGNGVTSIDSAVFYNCTNLTDIAIGNSVTSIGDLAFFGCTGLTSVTIPDGVTSIGSYAFYGCENLTSVTIPDSVTSIGSDAFRGCTGLTSVAIPDSVTSIDDGAFSGCTSLTSITIPDSVTSIGGSAFSGCTGLTSVTIPDSVTSIGDNALYACHDLNKVYFNIINEDTSITFGSSMFSSHPTIYCYMFTAPDVYFSSAGGYNVVYLEDIDVDTIRTVTLPNDFRLACGDTRVLACAVFPTDGTPIVWESSAPEVLTVENGTVTALTPGTATVTATVGTVSASVTIETFVPATGLTLNETEVWLQAKDSISLSVAAYVPENASATIAWSSSDTSLATVNENGVVTTIKPGDVTITATTDRGVTASCLLHLTYPVISVTLEPAAAELKTQQTVQLTTTAVTRNGSFTNLLVSFVSSDETVAAVDKNGLVMAIRPGTATITATAYSGKSASCAVTVTEMIYATLPGNLKVIEAEAFAGAAFEAVIIPDGCTTIGSRAFADCPNLLYVRIPASVTAIAEDAFEGCGQVIIDRVE